MSTEHLLSDIGAILHALTDSANEPRKEAEKHLRNLTVQSPGDVLLLLAQIGAQGVGGFQLEQRLLALILLRRLSFTSLPGLFLNESHHHASEPFEVIAERVRGRIETVLSAGLKDEMDVKMRKGLGTCAAGWASASAARQRPCLSFPPVLLELTSSPHPSHRFTPFQLLDTAPTLLIDSVREPLPISQLASLLLAGMNDPSIDVRVEALKAMRSVILEGVTGTERSEIGPSLIVEAYKSITSIPSSSLKYALDPLVELASVHANIFVQSFPVFLPYLLSLTSPPASPSTSYTLSTYPKSPLSYEEYEPIATSAIEILLCLAELKRNQVLEWEGGRLGSDMVGLLLGSLAAGLQEQPDDARDWMDETDIEEVDDSYPEHAEEAIDRLAMSLGGEVILPSLAQHAQAMLQQEDWRCRYAALVGIAGVADGCTDELIPRLQDVLHLVSPSAKDPHPRVRFAFLQSMGRLCESLQESIQTQYPQEVLKVLVEMLQDPVARVRTHAGACIVNFFDCDIPVLTSMLEPLVRSAISSFHAGPLYVQEQMFSTIASVATHAGGSFIPFYRETIDLCLSVLTTPTDASHRKLVGRAMECATMTGLAVGKATFAVDAVKLAQIMIVIQNNVSTDEDPRTAFLIDAWSCLCRTLGADFKPFLPHVIPPLLKSASYKPPVTREDGSVVEENEIDADVAKVRSGELDEKILAFDNLAVYAYTMRDHFSPYLAQCMELSLDALAFMHSEDVREAAAFLIPALLQVAKESKAWEQSTEPLQQVFQTVINAMAREQSWGYLALLYKSFTDSLHVIALSLPPQLISHLLRTCSSHLDDLRGAREDRLIQEEYMDEGDLDIYSEEQEEEDTALDYMAKALDMCVKYDKNVEVQQAVDNMWKRIGEVKRMRLRGERLD